MAALKTGMVSAHEARIATALRLDSELSGLRALEEASGICRKSVLKVLPHKTTGTTTLLDRTEIGKFAWDSEDRLPMVVEYRSFMHHQSSNPSNPQKVWETPQGDQKAERSEGISGARMTGVLDPSRDLWSNTDGGLGDHGWVLAMVTGLKTASFGLDELMAILRLGGRQLLRVLDKLEKLNWVRRVKEGRKTTVTVDFSLLVADPEVLADYGQTPEDLGLSGKRRARKAAQHMREAEAVEEMGTQEGRRIREMWKNRREEAERIRRLLEGIPENLRHRTNRILGILDTTDDRRDRNWVTRWVGESWIRQEMTCSSH